jgi:hypothetical protein
MKPAILVTMIFTAFPIPAVTVLAQAPYDQSPDPQAILNQMPHMQGMQELQIKYDNLKKEREQERKAVVDQIYEEELARAKKEQAAQGPFYDPYAASEWAAKQRVEQLNAQWKKEDQALDAQMHEEMMSSTGMGKMMQNQQEMMKQYGYTPPAR